MKAQNNLFLFNVKINWKKMNALGQLLDGAKYKNSGIPFDRQHNDDCQRDSRVVCIME